MKPISKSRREWFGGIVYSEHPGFTAYVGSGYADKLGIPDRGDLPVGMFSSPLDVHISITDRCNLHCQGCYVDMQTKGRHDMSLAMAKNIIEHLAEMNVFTVAFGGGEPFLHPELFTIANFARSKRIVPNVTTNGLLIDKRMAGKCHVFGNIHLSCHDATELVRLSSAVKCLQDEGINPGINVLISSGTYADLPEIWRWCARHHVAQVLALKFKLTEANRNFSDMLLSPAQEIELVPMLRKLSRKYKLILMVDCSLFPALAAHRLSRKELEFFDVNGCQGGNLKVKWMCLHAYVAVTTDGSYKPCSFCDKSLGKIADLNSKSWVLDTELRKFRQQRLYASCDTCIYLDLCNAGCRICAGKDCLVIQKLS